MFRVETWRANANLEPITIFPTKTQTDSGIPDEAVLIVKRPPRFGEKTPNFMVAVMKACSPTDPTGRGKREAVEIVNKVAIPLVFPSWVRGGGVVWHRMLVSVAKRRAAERAL
jgi:hypothetical protein